MTFNFAIKLNYIVSKGSSTDDFIQKLTPKVRPQTRLYISIELPLPP